MKTTISALLICLLLNVTLLTAQHPLEGTWEMISIKGINADGEPFRLDTTTVRETKIITPTHYILIARDKEDTKWTFNRCYAGTVKMDGDKYYEFPQQSSLPIFENVTTDFRWKVEGDRFIQSGTITRPDGKTIVLEEFVFRRLPAAKTTPDGAVGTWSYLQGSEKGLLIVTKDRWMSLLKNGSKLVDASFGEVVQRNGSPLLLPDFSSAGDTKPSPLDPTNGKLKTRGRTFEKGR